jgi:hypothetical protein
MSMPTTTTEARACRARDAGCYGAVVNFFGHAVVAGWYADDDGSGDARGGLALGAMLPDFASMIGARPPASTDAVIAAGIDLHHRTDAAFHRLPAFTQLQRALDQHLTAAGCRRGPTRACAHIGIELLLDGVLADDATARATYLAGIAALPSGLAWRDDGAADRFAVLQGRLRQHGVPTDLRDPEVAAHRLLRTIAHRPLLRADDRDAAIIRGGLAAFAARVEALAPAIQDGLRAALDDRAARSDTSGAAGPGSPAATSPR